MNWAGHAERIAEMRNAVKILIGRFGEVGIDGMIILERILQEYGVR
jgi:hypothetical protein